MADAPQPQAPYAAPPPAPSGSKKLLVEEILAGAAILALLAGAVLAYSYTRPTAEPVAGEEIETLVVEDETAGWQTYRNDNYRYSISYPPSYHVAYENDLFNFDEKKYEKGNPLGVKIQIQQDIGAADGFDLTDIGQQSEFIARLNSDIENSGEAAMETLIMPFTLGEIRYRNQVTSGPGGIFDVYYAFAANSTKYYRIFVWGAENDREGVKNILSTFKYTK